MPLCGAEVSIIESRLDDVFPSLWGEGGCVRNDNHVDGEGVCLFQVGYLGILSLGARNVGPVH